MIAITFKLSELHEHGPAFFDYLGLRKRFFVDTLGWDIPHNDTVEMDQYDNPEAYYSLVLKDGRVIGGARTMATSTCWGAHTYMLRDASEGKLQDIPDHLLKARIQTPNVWECTRLVISDSVVGFEDRKNCLQLIVDGLAHIARQQGAGELISLSPVSLVRSLRQLGYSASRIGEPYLNPGDGRRYAVLSMPTTREGAGQLAA